MLQLSIFLLGTSQTIQIGREWKVSDGVEVDTRKCISYRVADTFGVSEVGRVLRNKLEMAYLSRRIVIRIGAERVGQWFVVRNDMENLAFDEIAEMFDCQINCQ